jgi:hypothetical protein
MATIQELEQKKNALQKAVDKIKDNNLKASIETQIQEIDGEIQAMSGVPTTTPDNETTPNMDGMTPFMKAILSTLKMQMLGGDGSGVDSVQVRALIEQYLNNDKVKLSELDESVITEIKKNQIVKLSIPNFPKEIQIDKAKADIPNFYKIIDDVLAGNNVYLIGEAGGGKTYTAEQIAKTLERTYVTLNCSQYTSPLEILGGQSVEGFKQGKLIDCWKNGKILILDEMPKLDPNTAGLFNDALAKSSKTKKNEDQKINSADAEEPPIPRNPNFGIIATGNIYPNENPPAQYRGNNQQDLSLLDRFSGSVYYTEFDNNTDLRMTRFKFLYDFLVGNYYEYIQARNTPNTTLPDPVGLRTFVESIPLKNLALVSYRTITAFRVGFEYELVRAIAKKEGNTSTIIGKTLENTYESYLVAFRSSPDSLRNLIESSGYTLEYVRDISQTAINEILNNKDGWKNSLNDLVAEESKKTYERYLDFYTADYLNVEKNAS